MTLKHSTAGNLRVRNAFSFAVSVCIGLLAGCSSDPNTAEIKLERARMLMERNQAAEAIPILNEVVAAVPTDAEAWYQRGVAYEALNVLEKALNDYTECLKLDKDRTDALNNKAVVLAKMERFTEAAAEFTHLVDLDPSGPLAYRNRGLCHFDLGDYETALADYAKAIELDPNDPANWFQRAGVYLEQKRYQEAEQDYSKALDLDPELARAWMNRGVARYRRGEMKLASEDFTKAQELDSSILIPDIDFFATAATTETSASLPGTDSWNSVKTVAEQELSARGFTTITLIRQYPDLHCAEYSAELDATKWTILIACPDPKDSSVVLPAISEQATSENPQTALLMMAAGSGETPANVVRFQQPWLPTGTTEPLVMKYQLNAASP